MAYTDYFETVQKFYIGYYQRPADPEGLIFWAAKLEANDGKIESIIEAFANSAESQALYGTIDGSTIGNVIDSIYTALFGRAAEAEGKAFYTDGFNTGTFTAATIMMNILYGAQNEDRMAIENKLAAADMFTRAIDPELDGRDFLVTYDGEADAAAARAWLADVTWLPTTVPTYSELVRFLQTHIADTGDPIMDVIAGETFNLTAGPDTLIGTSGDDLFIAVYDEVGTATTLTFGDSINGAGGIDTLKIFNNGDDLDLNVIAVESVEKLHIANSYNDWDELDIAGRNFDQILIDVGGQESGGLEVDNVLSKTAVTLTNIEADSEYNYIYFKPDTASTTGNINVTFSNVDFSDYDSEYLEIYADFTNATTVNTTLNFSDLDDQGLGYYVDAYYYLDTGSIEDVAINLTLNLTNVLTDSSTYGDYYVYITQAGGSVNNVTVNLTNVDNQYIWLGIDDSSNGTSASDVVTFNLDGVANSGGYTELDMSDFETLNINVLSDSAVEEIMNYYNEDGSDMGDTTINLFLGADFSVEWWDLNDVVGADLSEATTFNITGSGNLTIAELDDGDSAITIDASAATGDIDITDGSGTIVSVTTGSGDDRIVLDYGYFVAGSELVVALGAGSNTLGVSNVWNETDIAALDFSDVTLSGVSILEFADDITLGADATLDLNGVGAISKLVFADFEAGGYELTIANAVDPFVIESAEDFYDVYLSIDGVTDLTINASEYVDLEDVNAPDLVNLTVTAGSDAFLYLGWETGYDLTSLETLSVTSGSSDTDDWYNWVELYDGVSALTTVTLEGDWSGLYVDGAAALTTVTITAYGEATGGWSGDAYLEVYDAAGLTTATLISATDAYVYLEDTPAFKTLDISAVVEYAEVDMTLAAFASAVTIVIGESDVDYYNDTVGNLREVFQFVGEDIGDIWIGDITSGYFQAGVAANNDRLDFSQFAGVTNTEDLYMVLVDADGDTFVNDTVITSDAFTGTITVIGANLQADSANFIF